MIIEESCEYIGMTDDEMKELKNIASGFSSLGRRAEKLGVHVFGGSGSGSLRIGDGTNRAVILAWIDGIYDGGDGACREDENGILRGE